VSVLEEVRISRCDTVSYKARLVAKCYTQMEDIDYNEVFSHVVKHSSIRILLALVAQYKLELDIKIIFLHGDLDETAETDNIVCKLKKSLYSLKQLSRQWHKHFDSFIRGKRYTRSHYNLCVYYNKLPGGEYVYLLLYVDDMLVAFRSRSVIDKLKKGLSSKFEMKILGKAKKVLDMKIKRDWKSGKFA